MSAHEAWMRVVATWMIGEEELDSLINATLQHRAHYRRDERGNRGMGVRDPVNSILRLAWRLRVADECLFKAMEALGLMQAALVDARLRAKAAEAEITRLKGLLYGSQSEGIVSAFSGKN